MYNARHLGQLPRGEGTEWGMLKRYAELKVFLRIHNRLGLSGRCTTPDTAVGSLSLRERAGVRVAFDVRVGLDVGNAFSRMLISDDHLRETPWPITIANC
jgi:hypothetical protein